MLLKTVTVNITALLLPQAVVSTGYIVGCVLRTRHDDCFG